MTLSLKRKPLLKDSTYLGVFLLVWMGGCAATVLVDQGNGSDRDGAAHADAGTQHPPDAGATGPSDADAEAPDPILLSRCTLANLRGWGKSQSEVLCTGQTSWILRVHQSGAAAYKVRSTSALPAGRGKVARHPFSAPLTDLDVFFIRDGALAQYTQDHNSFFLYGWNEIRGEAVEAVWADSEATTLLVSQQNGHQLVKLSTYGGAAPQTTWLPAASQNVGLFVAPGATAATLWAATCDELVLGVDAAQQEVPLPQGTFVTSLSTSAGPAILRSVSSKLHLVAKTSAGSWVDMPLAVAAGGQQQQALCDAPDGVAMVAVGEDTMLVGVMCADDVKLMRLSVGKSAAQVLSVEQRAAHKRELSFDETAQTGELLVDMDGGTIHVASRLGKTLRLYMVEWTAFDHHGDLAVLNPAALPIKGGEQPQPVQPVQPVHPCPEGQTQCEVLVQRADVPEGKISTCVDLATSRGHCGACGTTCVSGQCSQGKCVSPCFRSSECSYVCATRGTLIGGMARKRSDWCPPESRKASSCGSCSADETCTPGKVTACCTPRTCKRDAQCKAPGARCLAPDGQKQKRCLPPGHCIPCCPP